MKKYLKMFTEFRGVVVEPTMGGSLSMNGCKAYYAAHAINSHDELVAEVERLTRECNQLTEQLFEADAMVQEMQQIIEGEAE